MQGGCAMLRVCVLQKYNTSTTCSMLLLSYFGFRFTNVYNWIPFSSAYQSTAKKDVEAFCHKQDSLMHRVSSWPSAAINVGLFCAINLFHSQNCWRHWKSQFLSQLGGPIRILPYRLVRKNQNCMLTRWWKHFEDKITHFDKIHERDGWRDGWMDRQTSHDCRGCAST